ncbi:hypothetical protein ACCO45_004674 [Purpureocillium lilacinum]|uniref:Uncharacterized protein n=1 Tax=Purpureocillium lilacinum TaxID=33203 RepID=A0ACC4DT89_PURLI
MAAHVVATEAPQTARSSGRPASALARRAPVGPPSLARQLTTSATAWGWVLIHSWTGGGSLRQVPTATAPFLEWRGVARSAPRASLGAPPRPPAGRAGTEVLRSPRLPLQRPRAAPQRRPLAREKPPPPPPLGVINQRSCGRAPAAAARLCSRSMRPGRLANCSTANNNNIGSILPS